MEYIGAFQLDIRYKPGKENVVADALSRRWDHALGSITLVKPDQSFHDAVRAAYAQVPFYASLGNNPDVLKEHDLYY